MQAGCAKSRRPDCIFPNFPRISGIICYRLVSVDDQSLKDQKQKSIIHLSTCPLYHLLLRQNIQKSQKEKLFSRKTTAPISISRDAIMCP